MAGFLGKHLFGCDEKGFMGKTNDRMIICMN